MAQCASNQVISLLYDHDLINTQNPKLSRDRKWPGNNTRSKLEMAIIEDKIRNIENDLREERKNKMAQ